LLLLLGQVLARGVCHHCLPLLLLLLLLLL
jgi:hypothetical protein